MTDIQYFVWLPKVKKSNLGLEGMLRVNQKNMC